MKLKQYKHTYNNYTFYADSPEELSGLLTQLIIVAYDRNFIKKRYLVEQDPDKKADLKIMLDAAIKHYNKIRKELENPYR